MASTTRFSSALGRCFLLWTSTLHLYLETEPSARVRAKLEKRSERWIELDRGIERLVERFDVRYWCGLTVPAHAGLMACVLQALLRKKLYGEFVRHPRDVEDLLTSVVFGACCYAGSVNVALLPFLGAAKTSEGAPLSNRLRGVERAEFRFWPPWDRVEADGSVIPARDEPDLLLELVDADGRSSLLVIEAKLWSGKSSRPSSTGAVTDQLGKYWLGLKHRAGVNSTPLGVVYLVSGTTPPFADLEETQAELQAKGHDRAPLYWLSWRKFERVVDSSSAPPMIRDVIELLRDEWQLVEVEMGAWPTRSVHTPTAWTYDMDWSWPRRPPAAAWQHELELRWPNIPAGTAWAFEP